MKIMMNAVVKLKRQAKYLQDEKTLSDVEEYLGTMEHIVVTSPSGGKDRPQAKGKSLLPIL